MAELSGILSLAYWLGKSLGSSGALFQKFSSEFIGADIPAAVRNNNNVKTSLATCKTTADNLLKTSEELSTAGLNNNSAEIVLRLGFFGSAMTEYVVAVKTLMDGLDNAISPANIPDAAELATAQAFQPLFKKRLIDYIVLTSAEFITPQLLFLLKILGLADWGYTPASAADSVSVDYVKKELQLNRFKDLIKDPLTHFINTIGWGTDGFDPMPFFMIFTELMRREESFRLEMIDGDPVLDYGITKIRRLSSVSPAALAVDLSADFSKTVETRRTLTKTLGLNFSATISFDGGVIITITPPLDFAVRPRGGELSGDIKLFIDRHSFARPLKILDIGGFQLSVDNTLFGIRLEASWNAASGEAKMNPIIFADLSKGVFKLDTAGADSFIGKLLSNVNINGNFDLGFEWSGKDGLRIKASGGIEIVLPLHLSLGVIDINTLYLILQIKQDGTLSLETSVGFTGNLGPLTITVDRLGGFTNLSFSQNNDGKHGLFDLDLGFKPPNGVGLSINAGAVIGGGYLFFDFDKQEYAGVLELTIAGFISAKAIGLVTTKMPDGNTGFSMLIIITAEFMPPFQLGYGFTLIGVGGLLGLNRTMLLDPLRNAVRTGAVNSIMFPQNVIANAPRIISDLKAIFPPYEGKFLIGPMGKLGWGTPTLVSLSLGLIIEIPGNIAILGSLKIALPEERIAIIQIQVLFVGTIDFDRKMLTFDASLYESFVLTMTLEGDMAVRLKWGDDPDFILTAGGFHPSYTPPPLALPTLRRMAINILNIEVAKIRIECYQALTSNTVQFGSKAELYFGFSAISVSGHIQFDALFQFSPFYFIIEVSGSVSLEIFSMGVFSIRLRFTLEGPTPWRAKGRGSISFFFFDVSADFDKTWGDSQNTSLPDIQILPPFLIEIGKREQWSTVLSTGKNLLVSLRKFNEAAPSPLVLHPAGSLVVQQKLLPLEAKIDKIGNQKLSDVQKLTISAASSAGISLTIGNVNENFARAQYQNLTDAEKLSKPSFEKMPGGVSVSMGSGNLRNGEMVRKKVEYEITIIDKEIKKPFSKGKFFLQVGLLFTHFLKGNSVSQSPLSKHQKDKLTPFAEKMDIGTEKFAVAFQSNNKAFDSTAVFESQFMAETFMSEQITSNPSLGKQIHIIPNYELQS